MVTKWAVAGAAVLVIGLSLGAGLALMDRGSGAVPNNDEALAAAALASGSGMSEGIKVHGDWVIDVRDPDGSLVDHKEFENSLTTGGHIFLARVLSRDAYVGGWRILFHHSVGRICPPLVPNCEIVEQGDPNSTYSASGLALSLDAVGGTFTLKGNITASYDGTIIAIQTLAGRCASTSVCYDPFNSFSRTDISPLPVLAGQQVQVTVTFSFS